MALPFIGEIKMFGGNFAPLGWMFCSGQTMPISGNDALFSLIGTTYGGDGQTTFRLPDLQSRFPIHQGQGPGLSNYFLGQASGVESVTVTSQQLGAHTHAVGASTAAGDAKSPANAVFATAPANIYGSTASPASMHPSTISVSGGNQPHENMPPYACVNFIIATEGIYPTLP